MFDAELKQLLTDATGRVRRTLIVTCTNGGLNVAPQFYASIEGDGLHPGEFVVGGRTVEQAIGGVVQRVLAYERAPQPVTGPRPGRDHATQVKRIKRLGRGL
jgi:hypothetical protein